MLTKIETGLDFLIAKARALHSQVYEGDRLLALLRHRTLIELAGELFPNEAVAGHMGLQRRLVERYAVLIAQLWRYLGPPRDQLFAAMVARLQIENMKLWLRMRVAGRGDLPEQLPLIAVPEPFRWLGFDPTRAKSVSELVNDIPEQTLRDSAREGLLLYNETELPIYVEAGLDRGYFRLLAESIAALPAADRKSIADLVSFEGTLYNLMFILRCRVNYDLDGKAVAALAAPDAVTGHVASWVRSAAQQQGVREIVAAAPRSVRDRLTEVPPELPAIERRLWRRYYALANRTYFGSLFDVGCLCGYAAARRMELANLITTVEVIRYGMTVGDARQRFVAPEA
ncbi:MAG: V-type ATPase subunit [Planctomycetes bacterium]|nr:V-type ATPase subunit [Planctomycetota bacterium]